MAAGRFDFQHVVHGDLFVDRKGELATLQRSFEGVNLLLIAPRRLGKSSLIKEAFRRAPEDGPITLYLDISFTTTEADVAGMILTELGRAAFGKLERGWHWLLERLKASRPSLRIDPETGMPRIDLEPGTPEIPSLEEALRALQETAERKGRRVVVAIDEFQVLVERDNAGTTIRKMRAIIQHQDQVSYILCGSKAHVLRDLIEGPERPFWQQLEPVEVGGIPIEHFRDLATDVFRAHGHDLPDPVLERVGHLCEDNPKRIQELFSGLLALGRTPTTEDVDHVLRDQIDGQHHLLDDLFALVKEGTQKRLLVGLAREGSGHGVYGAAFIARYGLGTSGHVAKAVAGLQAKGILNERNHFVDPYLYHYVRSRVA